MTLLVNLKDVNSLKGKMIGWL